MFNELYIIGMAAIIFDIVFFDQPFVVFVFMRVGCYLLINHSKWKKRLLANM